MAHSILICDDNVAFGESLQGFLRTRGFHVTLVRSGREALERLRREPPDLLLLDLMLPDMDGFDVCRRMRGHCAIPVIVISGRSSEIDCVVVLEIGADAYLVKPFGQADLAARIEALLRRSGQYATQLEENNMIEIGDLRLDVDSHGVWMAEAALRLTPKEFDLLAALAEHRGSVVRSSQLLLRVWGYDASIRTRTLDVHIGRLRAKIEQNTRRPRYILTVPGVGYKLCAPETESRAA